MVSYKIIGKLFQTFVFEHLQLVEFFEFNSSRDEREVSEVGTELELICFDLESLLLV